jgi:hypothetical protein
VVLLVALAVLSGAAHGRPLPRCNAQGYGLEETPAIASSTIPDTVLITVGWLSGTERRRACVARTTVHMTVRGPGGGVAARAVWRVNAVLQPWDAAVHTWAWRNWCIKGGNPRIDFADASGRHLGQIVPHPPRCTNAHAQTSVAILGDGTKYHPRTGDVIAPRFLTDSDPPPVNSDVISIENGMVVSDGYTLVVVYAGNPKNDASIGRLVVIRQNLLFGIAYSPPDVIDVGKVGRLKIRTLPKGGARSAQRAEVGFVAKDGTHGVLDLRGDTAHLEH